MTRTTRTVLAEMTARSLAMAAPDAITTTRERKRSGLGWMELVALVEVRRLVEAVRVL